MDYSSTLAHDPENPAGSSPWATSPKQSRTMGASGNNDVPSGTLAGPPQSPFGAAPSDANPYSGRPSTSDSTTVVNAENGDNDQSPYQQSQQQQQQPAPQRQYQPQDPQLPPPAMDDQRRPQAQRYHNRPQQSQQPQQPQYAQHQQPQQPRSHPQYKLQCKITGLERTGKKDPILRFDAYTNLPKFRTTQFRDVRRTHSEFVKFGEYLIASNPEAIVPAVPAPLTAAGAGTDEDENRVKNALQKWFNVICSNEVLMRDDEMVFFIESDFGYSPVVRRKQPATGARRKYIKQFAPPPDDTPELLEARPIVKSFYLGTMDAGQKVDKVVKHRRSLGLAEADLGLKMQQMQGQETHAGLGNAYRKLGKVIQTVGDYHAAQGTAEATTFSDPLAYHSSDAFIVKETLTNRHILLRELLQAQQTTFSRTNAANRLKASSSVKRDKVDDAISALDEAKAHEQYLTDKCTAVTANLVHERRKWFTRTATDLQTAIREYVIRQIEAERRTLATYEQVRPDVRNVDASGGLSRLGREATPAARRSNLASSQGPKGDAWSGVARRPDALNRSMSGSVMGGVTEEGEGEEASTGDVGGTAEGRKRATSSASTLGRLAEDDDEDRVDARNAASRLAQTTF